MRRSADLVLRRFAMSSLFARPFRSLAWAGSLWLLALHASVEGQLEKRASADPARQDAFAELAAAQAVETLPVVLLGCVLGPDGAPREGVVVTSSAGGRA